MTYKKISQAKSYLCVCLLLLSIACNQKKETYQKTDLFNQNIEKLYTTYLINAFYGYYNWNKGAKKLLGELAL